jgi:hypothetical protein
MSTTVAKTIPYPIVGLCDLSARACALSDTLTRLAGSRDDMELVTAAGEALELARYCANAAVALHDLAGWRCEP